MNAKKANWLYLSTLLFEFFLVAVMIVLGDKIEVGILQSLVLSQMMILLPTVVFLIGTKTDHYPQMNEIIYCGCFYVSLSAVDCCGKCNLYAVCGKCGYGFD